MLVRGCGLGGIISIRWNININENLVYYEGQWLMKETCDSFTHIIKYMYWIPRKLRGELDYFLAETK